VLREEPRRGIRFYELAHDRLILPIRRSNRKWIETHYTALAAQADGWKKANRPDDKLLASEAAAKAQPESKLEQEFVIASKQFRMREERRTRELQGRTNLAVTGWGIIFASDADPATRDALQPLLAHRRQQVASGDVDRYREFNGPLGYQPGESAENFLTRNGAFPGVQNASTVPFYLLLVGNPQTIPFDFQFGLSIQYAVGRIDLESAAQYAIYARSVVACESADFALPRRVGIFAPAHEGDRATEMISRLAYPFVERLKSYPDWTVEAAIKDDAIKQRLSAMIGGDGAPVLLFVLCHGLDARMTDKKQKELTGALLCQDWEGHGPPTDKDYFAASDLAADAHVLGSVLSLVAASTAGLPEFDDFTFSSGPQQRLTEQAFTASLPRRLLAHPNGGALAVIGHLDRNWAFSLFSQDYQRSSGLIESLCISLMSGHTVGSAMALLGQRVSMLAATLVDELLAAVPESTPKRDAKQSSKVIALRDVRNYIILGDPAVRLAITSEAVAGPRPVLPAVTLTPVQVPESVANTKSPSQDVFFNGYSVLSNTYLQPSLSANEISSIVRGVSLDGSRQAYFLQWYDVATRSEAL
jgi:hypothetical protein